VCAFFGHVCRFAGSARREELSHAHAHALLAHGVAAGDRHVVDEREFLFDATELHFPISSEARIVVGAVTMAWLPQREMNGALRETQLVA
jgi:hypothetical protein